MLMQKKRRTGLPETGHGYFDEQQQYEQHIGLKINYIKYL
jgi:hypothetical protein